MEIMTLNCDEAGLLPLLEREIEDKSKRNVPAEVRAGADACGRAGVCMLT